MTDVEKSQPAPARTRVYRLMDVRINPPPISARSGAFELTRSMPSEMGTLGIRILDWSMWNVGLRMGLPDIRSPDRLRPVVPASPARHQRRGQLFHSCVRRARGTIGRA